MRLLLVVTLIIASGSGVQAGPILLESHVGHHQSDSDALLAPLHDEFLRRGYTSGESLGHAYEARVSRPSRTAVGIPPHFASAVEDGHRAWVSGDFDGAIQTLAPLVGVAFANPAELAQAQGLRQSLLKALIALALSQQRNGDLAAARDTLREMLRSFPDADVSRATYGPDAHELFEDVQRESRQSATGRLTVRVRGQGTVVFVDEHFEKVGAFTKNGLAPGPYRVFAQSGTQTSRLHVVNVNAGMEATVEIDPLFDSVLQTSGSHVGLLFPDSASREQNETTFAARFAREMGATALAVVGTEETKGYAAIVGSVVGIRSSKEIRRASLAIAPTPTPERIQGLAEFLTGNGIGPFEGIQVEIVGEVALSGPSDKPVDSGYSGSGSPSSKLLPLSLGGGALVLLTAAGGLSLWADSTYDDAKSETQNQSRRDDLFNSANARRYSAEGVAVAGAACLGVAVWIYFRGRDDKSSTVTGSRKLLISPNYVGLGSSF